MEVSKQKDELSLLREANEFLIREYMTPYVDNKYAKEKIFLNDTDDKIFQLESMVTILEKWLQEAKEKIKSCEKEINLLKKH